MTEERIDVASDRATLILSGRPADTIRLAEVQQLHVVHMASGLLHGEEPFFVLVLPDRVWVVPDCISGWDALQDALTPKLLPDGAVLQASAENVPLAWRARVAGFLPLFPTPRLGCHPIRTLPHWPTCPIDPADLESLRGVEA